MGDANRETKQQMKGKKMKDQMPNILPSGRGSFSKEGTAPEPGGTRYRNLGMGYHTMVYEGLAIKTGGRFIRVSPLAG